MRVSVREGDTLNYYSQLFDIPLRLILDSNRELYGHSIKDIEKVSIPGYIKQDYMLKKGETIWSVSMDRGIALDALYLMNPDLDPYSFTTGDIVYIPVRVTKRIVKVTKPYDYKSLMSDLNRLQVLYPFLKQESIGRSVLRKSIPEVRIGRGESKIHFNGSFHAREWITSAILTTFLNDYCLSITTKRSIRGINLAYYYENIDLSVVPMVNPDGVDLAIHGNRVAGDYKDHVMKLNDGSEDFSKWKANIRGVDLNNQFPAKWEIEQARKPQAPAPENFPGEKALCEPESKAMATLTVESDFDRVLALHTQGQEIYWGFEGQEPQEAERLAQEFSRVSGYEAIQTLDSYAGYKDWFIQEWRRPGFTIECGEGDHPLPLEQFPKIYQETLGQLLAALYM
ncbi:M14 family metallopeptidase [Pullulanibacillus sp. KACC 23026]|uniref:M14 family metallopeptidase n=1 Tax=Pullulanibacillus sp. KACC 23026 TaxID=3028315 RepID=UPI0023B0A07D|nr:M14 family metallopeptidase [Pullulanibacillus sp. KACC 23026]WEG14276.1 M14 family metallopeptidase [Pullulanibacillus sp. KACC 23026]